ncbi:protein prenyltransferase alpha subunit repeat-containing protein 1 isoform X11 [Syngnathus scovelli]|uniref:protein prenyltransferase alpha subunit repeat-containing protein 1 isoform X11 n=1 Tax=Syngnathus scovelli TaxID=161590 RepID=UPI0035CB1866
MAESRSELDVLVQRVVKDISNALKRNPNIDEIGVIPCPEGRYNRSPIVVLENKLGVESWCLKFLLPYVHSKLLLYRQQKHWLDKEALVDITSTLLLLNPDFTTAWNVRKELIQRGVLTAEMDLYLGKLALTKFPKSPETWIHRSPVPAALEQHQTLTLPPPCLTVGKTHLSLYWLPPHTLDTVCMAVVPGKSLFYKRCTRKLAKGLLKTSRLRIWVTGTMSCDLMRPR